MDTPNKTPLLILALCLLLAPITAWTNPPITGPVAAKVIKVYEWRYLHGGSLPVAGSGSKSQRPG